MNQGPSLRIIIVNWNAGEQLRECLDSIRPHALDGIVLERVIVVDNNSSDGSLACLDGCDLPHDLFINDSNRGFAAACNQGALGSQADYLLFLNPDTRLGPRSLVVPVAFMEAPENERVGICGIQLLNSGLGVSRSCSRFPSLRMLMGKSSGLHCLFPGWFPDTLMTEWDHLNSAPVDQVIGAFFLVRRPLFEHLGGFDERFFVYYEEVDFSLRARKEGWISHFIAEAQAYHRGQGTTEGAKGHRLFCSVRSRILYVRKHFDKSAAMVVVLVSLFWEPIARIGGALVQGAPATIRDAVRGYLELWKYFLGRAMGIRRGTGKGTVDRP
ncbi:MAG: glycosyltransferase family 2 protein [Acidobacteriota bacterium]|nr:glycosyltransferase family 2 protein [Acidobacteriota bacterium]NLT33294.1 glycosyltransferase family 2 protein [Acidobacteriota bacterium]